MKYLVLLALIAVASAVPQPGVLPIQLPTPPQPFIEAKPQPVVLSPPSLPVHVGQVVYAEQIIQPQIPDMRPLIVPGDIMRLVSKNEKIEGNVEPQREFVKVVDLNLETPALKTSTLEKVKVVEAPVEAAPHSAKMEGIPITPVQVVNEALSPKEDTEKYAAVRVVEEAVNTAPVEKQMPQAPEILGEKVKVAAPISGMDSEQTVRVVEQPRPGKVFADPMLRQK